MSDINLQEKIQELQILEQNLQAILSQKQSTQIEINECDNALAEIEKSPQEIYRVVGNIMLRSSKEDTKAFLDDKKKILELRINSIEKQEKLLNNKANDLQKEITSSISKKDKTE